MPKVLSKNLENDIKFILNYFIEPKEYSDWVNKIRTQYLKNVEVPGFRKGMAPQDLVMKQINPAALSDTIFRETLDKFGGEAILEMQKELAIINRVGLSQTYGIDPENTKESDDGFLIVLSVELLPEVDLTKIENLKYDKVTDKDLLGRLSLQDYIEKEKKGYILSHNHFVSIEENSVEGFQVIINMTGTIDGKEDSRLTAENMAATIGVGNFLPEFEKGITGVKKGDNKSFEVIFPIDYFEQSLAGLDAIFNVHILDVKKPDYHTFDEIVQNTSSDHHQGHNHPNFTSEAEFDAFITDYYRSETQKMVSELNQRNIIKAVVDQIPSFALPTEKIDTETDRIFGVLSEDSLRAKISVAQAFGKTDLPGSDKKVKNDDEVRTLIYEYVQKEFKLAAVWNYIYEMKVTEKISNETLTSASLEIAKNPQAYGIHVDAGQEEIRDNTFAMLKKQLAANWLFNEIGSEKEVVKDLDSKPKKAIK
ncbi:MAG: FKBP-type peptidyl-prolyl cis-trans isomerase [candidate division SR1 bacterium]|nr:FKBP-type peptidyl-prolyl cis-trans isomerase [candidate division SR1 bacterium]